MPNDDVNHQPPEASSPDTRISPTKRTSRASTGEPNPKRRTVNFVLQGKGGCGKTVVASLLAQSIQATGEPLVCIDTDPTNKSFADITSLRVERVQLLNGMKLNVEVMNEVISRVADEDTNFVFDNGAGSYQPMMTYLLEAGLFEWLAEAGKRVVVHVPVIGSEALSHMVIALEHMTRTIPACVDVIPWHNPFFGPLVTDAGIDLEETEMYAEMAARFHATIKLPALNPDYSGACFAKILKNKQTFADARADQSINRLSKMFLEQAWAPIHQQIQAAW